MFKQLEFDLKLKSMKVTKIFLVLLFSSLLYFFIPDHNLLGPAARAMLFIFSIAVGLWILEPIPPFATSLVIIGLQIYILGKPGGVLAPVNDYNYWTKFLLPIASPLMIIFLAGFVLAKAASKHYLDQKFVHLFMKYFAKDSTLMLIGIIFFTALFSMFMSNTATTAMMFALIMPMMKEIPDDARNLRKAIVLAVPFSANIGGLGTIIGSPPNLIAVGIINNIMPENQITFLDWMLFGVPLVAVLLAFLYVLLKFYFPVTKKIFFDFKEREHLKITWDAVTVYITFTVVVVMWLTEKFHNIPTAMIAILPIIIFTITSIIDAKDINSISWNILILVSGGLCIGKGMQLTGLDVYMANVIPYGGLGFMPILMILMFLIIVLSNFMSNTAAANILVPVAVSISFISPVAAALTVAIGASLAMSLPISTPPNSIAYDTGEISTRDLGVCGSTVSLVGGILVLIVFYFIG